MTSVYVPVAGPDQAAEARRAVQRAAHAAGLGETEAGQAAIVATECATNIVKHAREGVLLIQQLSAEGCRGVEILALDKGPGMSNIAACLQDGYSSAGSAGTGLGAIRRLASDFDVYSQPGHGTAVLVRIWKRGKRVAGVLQVGAVSIPQRGETACGDAWSVRQMRSAALILVADGIGHGEPAAVSSRAAVSVFCESAAVEPARLISEIHLALRSTRGAAAAVALIEPQARRIRFAGIGNVAGQVRADVSGKALVSQPGTLGSGERKVREFTYPWPEGALLLLYSDGLTSHMGLERYPGLDAHDPSLIAGVLYRDFTRGRDDATVVVARESVPA